MGSKISVLTLALMMGATSLFAEDNGKAIDYYKVGMYGEAKKELLANLQSGKTDKAEVCYYLGELYSAQNMKDSAAYYYKEGIRSRLRIEFDRRTETRPGEQPERRQGFQRFSDR